MRNTVVGTNPGILRWARERASLSLDAVAKRMKKDSAVIESWETGDSAPTYVQLETLAYSVYKLPIAIFFFPDPPVEISPQEEFRTLPDVEIQRLSPDTRFAIRRAQGMQVSLKELSANANPADNLIFRDLRASPDDAPIQVARAVRDYLGVSVDDQLNWHTVDEALKAWRTAVERVGVFVFKRALKQRSISGFCLVNEEFPVIYLNNSTTMTRQIFTLFHELAHVLLSTSGITLRDDRYIENLPRDHKVAEVFCNRLADEILVPLADFQQFLSIVSWDDNEVSDIADRYKVSREVILRKALDRGLVTPSYYRGKASEWASQYRSRAGQGGYYYATQATYFGEAFLRLAFGKHYRGQCTIEQLAEHLGMKVENVTKLEDYFLTRSVRT